MTYANRLPADWKLYFQTMGVAVKVTGVFFTAESANEFMEANPGQACLASAPLSALTLTAHKDDLGTTPAASAFEAMKNALQEAHAWTLSDLRNFDDIAPNTTMLRARSKVLKAALKLAEGCK